MTHVLDRPVWSALTTRQAQFAEGGPLALRFRPTTIPFAAARDNSAECLAALAALFRPGEEMVLAEPDEVVIPEGFTASVSARVVQMTLTDTPPPVADARIERLTDADAAEMLALATLTKPGPFTLGAQALGPFFGVKIGGRLAAMAGVRMKQPGYTEMSGVCSHPDFRQRGLGRLLSVFMTHRILDAGDTPYLHAFATNEAAIGLYRSIGYEVRTTLNVAMIKTA
jgi:predicted GNAT family acetyltransferase